MNPDPATSPAPETPPTPQILRFRKKPVEIFTVRWDGSLTAIRLLESIGLRGHKVNVIPPEKGHGLRIATLEGEMRADPGDWIIKGVKGEFYPCKPDIFAATYDAIESVTPRDGGTPNASYRDLERALAEAKRENGELKLRIAAINGQRNVMANSVNGQNWAQYWAADTRMGELVGGDYDHQLATGFTVWRINEEMKTEIERLKAERQWQPIETAPRDGTHVLMLSFNNVVESGYYSINKVPPGWCAGGGASTPRVPRKWMPLPDAARTTQEGQG